MNEKKTFRVTLTLSGELAKRFEKIAKQKFGNIRTRRAKLMRIAAECIVGCEGNVTFAHPVNVWEPKKKSPIPSKEETARKVERTLSPVVAELKKEGLYPGKSWGALKFAELRAQLTGDSPYIL